jgi:GTP-dependent dephospho-CoA kinase
MFKEQTMKIVYTLTPDLRIKLKEPFGTLIEGNANETMAKLKKLVLEKNPTLIVSVGDVVSKNMHSSSVHPLISIIDNISLRNKTETTLNNHCEKTIHVKNPPGTITEEAINALSNGFSNKTHTHIIVEGEEDLLTLIAVLYAPQNAFVIYGQPHCGIVVVKVTSEKKAKVKKFLNHMKTTKS